MEMAEFRELYPAFQKLKPTWRPPGHDNKYVTAHSQLYEDVQ
jgi:hypothetical protein